MTDLWVKHVARIVSETLARDAPPAAHHISRDQTRVRPISTTLAHSRNNDEGNDLTIASGGWTNENNHYLGFCCSVLLERAPNQEKRLSHE
jgi:hypothetical protein